MVGIICIMAISEPCEQRKGKLRVVFPLSVHVGKPLLAQASTAPKTQWPLLGTTQGSFAACWEFGTEGAFSHSLSQYTLDSRVFTCFESTVLHFGAKANRMDGFQLGGLDI